MILQVIRCFQRLFWNRGPHSLGAWLALVTIGTAQSAMTSEPLNADSATHKSTHAIRALREGSAIPFHTFRLSPDRQLWLCCSNPNQTSLGVLLIYDVMGSFVRAIDLPFVATAMAFHKDENSNAVFLAGSGKIARMNNDGSNLLVKDAPNIGNREEVLADLRKEAAKQAEELISGTRLQSERVKNQMTQLESVPAGETPEQEARRMRRLKLLRQQDKQIQLTLESLSSGEAGINAESLKNLERATAMAFVQGFVFVSLPTVPGYGYDVWRVDMDLNRPTKVIERGSGCCGQFDIQSDGKHLVIAQNTDFQVAYYDLDGKPISKFGRKSAVERDGFGSCCNPMNIQCEGDEVLTAESSIGHIKRFKKSGEFVAYIGRVSIGGGCKHVALAHDLATDRYFMFNEDRKCISVLVPKSQASDESDEERAARIAMEGLGKRLIGKWNAKPSATSNSSIEDFLRQKFQSLHFQDRGKLVLSKEKYATSNSNILSQLTKLSGSEEAAQMLSRPCEIASWSAIEQNNDILRILFVEDGVSSFESSIHFSDANQMTVTFAYGSNGAIAQIKYTRAHE